MVYLHVCMLFREIQKKANTVGLSLLLLFKEGPPASLALGRYLGIGVVTVPDIETKLS